MMKLAALLLAALTTIAWTNATTSTTPETTLAGAIVRAHARACGGAVLGHDTRLTWIARYRAIDMLANGYFDHTNPWTHRHSYDYMRRVGIGYHYAAEIIGWNSYPDDLAAGGAFNAFMRSSSHRAAILSCRYTRYGVGDYKAYGHRMFVVLFIRP